MKMWPSLISLDQFQGTESLTSSFHFVVTLVTKSEANFDYTTTEIDLKRY